MKIDELKKYHKILILGYGKEGMATENFLRKFVPNSEIGISDKNDGAQYLDRQKDYDLVIKTPGIPKRLVTVSYTTASNIFLANVKNKVIGITGTKGKSTTASLINAIINESGTKSHLVGNIGSPALSELTTPTNDNDIFVFEFSSYQLDDIKYSPQISVILDLYPEHMDYHGTVDAYYKAKQNIIRYVKPNDYFVFDPRFTTLNMWAETINCHKAPFVQILPIKDEDIPLIGDHNRDNVKAAMTVANILKIPVDTAIKAIKKFKSLPHRLEFVGNFKEIFFYDDAISTTPESTIFAIKALKNIGTIFLGGQNRGYKFNKLVDMLVEFNIPNLVFFPDSGEQIFDLLPDNFKTSRKILKTRDMTEAVKFAYANTPKNTVCLLSTASPSYSVWKNFEEKGDLFQFEVKKLGR